MKLTAFLAHTILTRSPAHAKWELDNRRDEPTKEIDIGSAAHAILLLGDESCIVEVPFDDWRKNDAREMRDAARAERKIPILSHKLPILRAMVEVAGDFIARTEWAADWRSGVSETPIVWNEEGIECRGRPDRVGPAAIFDYKTCSSANPDAWSRHVVTMGYDIQAAFYMRGMHQLSGVERKFIWFAQESDEPYACALMGMSPMLEDFAARRLDRAIRTWQKCVASGRFPGYPQQTCWLEPPSWAMAQEEEQQYFDENGVIEP